MGWGEFTSRQKTHNNYVNFSAMDKSLVYFDLQVRDDRPVHSRRMLLRSEQKWCESLLRLKVDLTEVPTEEVC